MFFRLTLRKFWILLFVLSLIGLVVNLTALFYGLIVPQEDFVAIIRALEIRGTPPSQVAADVNQVIHDVGPLRRIWQVGHYSEFTGTLKLGSLTAEKRTQATYIAWFSKLSRPIVLVLERHETGGVLVGYVIGEGEWTSLVQGLALSFILPLVIFCFTAYKLRRKS